MVCSARRKKVKSSDPNYDRVRWWIEHRLNARRIHKAMPEARTKNFSHHQGHPLTTSAVD
jgi:hypothetical protein